MRLGLFVSPTPPSFSLDGEGVCFHPESRAPHSNDSSPAWSFFFLLFFPPFLSRVFRCLEASSSPLYHGQGRDQDRKRAELSLAVVYTPKVVSLSCHYPPLFFFPPQLRSKNTKRKNKAMRIGVPVCVCVCVCAFRDFRVRGGHLKPFPSQKRAKTNIK